MTGAHRLMTGHTWHRRYTPVKHGFTYALTMALVDLDDVDGLLRRHPLWGRQWRPVTLRCTDFVDDRSLPLRRKVEEKAAQQGMDFSGGRILMLAQLRGLGWLFNPLVLYWHLPEGAEEPDALLAEVRNTPWNERHWYALPGTPEAFRHGKTFHVSPFMPMDLEYEWRVRWGDRLRVRLRSLRAGTVIFEAGMRLSAQPADASTMARLTPRFLLQGLRTSRGIYRQAWRLWRRGLPFHRHPDRGAQEGGD